MYCAECGKPVAANAKHCVYCGTPVTTVEGETSEVARTAPAPRVQRTPPPVPPSFGAIPPPVPPRAYAATPPPPPAAYGYAPAAPAKRSVALRYAAAGCFVLALVGSFLPFVTAGALGGDADDSSSFMFWRDGAWGPITGALVVIALACALLPRRWAALVGGLLGIPALALILYRGLEYLSLGGLGIDIDFGLGWYLLLLFTLAGLALSLVAFTRIRGRAR
jgi:hypothetical protein